MGRPALWETIACAECGAIVRTKPHLVRKGRRYCGPSCSGKANHRKRREPMAGNRYAWRGDNATRWAMHKRAHTIKPDGACERCGGDGTVVHHRDENPSNNAPENLERLCRPCHVRHHHAKKRIR